MPREDLDALGVKYRRIPILSIGRDIYCDTRLIIQKLEARFPVGALGASAPNQKAVEKLLENWTIDGGIFARAAQAIPPEMPLMKDSTFTKDREEYTGRSWSQENVRAARPEALVHLKEAFDFLERGFLADGRDWILKTDQPSLADINGTHIMAYDVESAPAETSCSYLAFSLASEHENRDSILSFFRRPLS